MMPKLSSQVLKYFNASPRDYKCIFTSGATAALKLVGECFPWSRESCYMYTMENHNSVLGIREYPSIQMLNVRFTSLSSWLVKSIYLYASTAYNITMV
jgi:molybdenum cofactor sulfurtransferase